MVRSAPVLLVLAACGAGADPAPVDDVLVYSRTLGYRHADAIDAGLATLPDRLAAAGMTMTATEDPGAFTPENLARYRAVVFFYTSGDDILDADGKAALEAFVRGGGGWVGLHSAADTEYAWPFYQQLVVAPFARHPPIQEAAIDVTDRAHPAMAVLPAGRWIATDEWYDFGRQPRDVAGTRVLATLDEASYDGGMMGADHPIIWAHETLGGRCFYSALGHVAPRWQEPALFDHVVAAIAWAHR